MNRRPARQERPSRENPLGRAPRRLPGSTESENRGGWSPPDHARERMQPFPRPTQTDAPWTFRCEPETNTLAKAGQGCRSSTSHEGTAAPGCPAEKRSACFACGRNRVELRSTGQLRAAVPTWFVVKTSGFAYAGCVGTSFRLFFISQNTVASIPSQPRKLMTAAIFVSYCSTPRLEKMVCQSCST